MQLQQLCIISCWLGLVTATCDTDHEWRLPQKHDSRSPCPGLNALANHGWLPRSGRNIDLKAVQDAASAAYNHEMHLYDDAVKMVFDFNLSTSDNPSQTFHLDDLKAHDKIEFDGSLSRNDFYFGDDLHFDPKIWATMAHRLRLYEDEDEKYVTVESAAKARAARVKDAMAANPTFNASAAQQQGTYGTTALYLATLWDTDAAAAPKAWVKAFFEEERIAFSKPKIVKTQEFLTDMNKAVIAVQV